MGESRFGEGLDVVRDDVIATEQPGQRLVLVEATIERNQVALAAWADVHMMVVCDEGRERSRAELEALLAAAGFRPARFYPSPMLAVLEGIAV